MIVQNYLQMKLLVELMLLHSVQYLLLVVLLVLFDLLLKPMQLIQLLNLLMIVQNYLQM